MSLEDQIRDTIKSNRLSLKSTRISIMQCMAVKGGKLEPDKLFRTEYVELQKQEQNFIKNIETLENILVRAGELSEKFQGINRSNPLTSLKDQREKLKTDIAQMETDITLLTRKNEVHGAGFLANDQYKERISAYNKALKEARPELVRVQKAIEDIEKAFRAAGANC